MIFKDGELTRLDLIRVVLLTLLTYIGFWNSGFILPVLIAAMTGLAWVYVRKGSDVWGFEWIDLLMIFLCLIELISFVFSVYKPNSFLSLEKMFFWVLFYFVLRYGLKNDFIQRIFYSTLGVYGLMLSCGALLSFFILKATLLSEGWLDASQFKALYSPFGFRNNDWATIALCFLPFPLLSAVLFRSVKGMIVAGLFGFSLIVYSVLTSFSRGAYLSLGVFIFVLLSGIIRFRLVKTKTWIVLVLATGGMLALMTIPVYQPMMTTLAMNKTVSQQRSTQGRLETFRVVWCKVKEHWMTGMGAYNFALSGQDCRSTNEDAGDSIFTNNLYLQIFIEKGLGGLLVYSLLFLILLGQYFRNLYQQTDKEKVLIHLLLFAGLFTYFFRELFFASFFESNPVMVMVAVYAALRPFPNQHLVNHIQGHDDHRGTVKKYWGSSVLPYLLLGLFLVGTAWIYYTKGRYKKAEGLMNEASKAQASGDLQKAIGKMDQALLVAPDLAPYHEMAGLISGQINWNPAKVAIDSMDLDQAKLAVAVSHLERAIQINPDDAGFHFNLACLLFLQHHSITEVARTHFIKALNSEPANVEFLIGYGLLSEYSRDTVLAFALYEKAIRLDPELLQSEFFEDLARRRPSLPDKLTTRAILHLKNQLNSGYNTVFTARLGLLYWSTSNFVLAKKLFNQVMDDLPDLYRPYYYLGRMAELENDSILAQRLYQKSLYLNNRDYLAPLKMGDYYYYRLTSENNIAYSVVRHYKNGLINILQYPTIHRNLARLQYKSTISVTNDLILMNLGAYTRMKVDFTSIALRLAEVYKMMGRPELESYYLQLSSRDLVELNSGDIQ